ncbi:MAG: hypothetical protein J6A11_09810 [Lachnospiraceae bacterium]|nr:hypothetical protein [Lachnospiraceae bacterium]
MQLPTTFTCTLLSKQRNIFQWIREKVGKELGETGVLADYNYFMQLKEKNKGIRFNAVFVIFDTENGKEVDIKIIVLYK